MILISSIKSIYNLLFVFSSLLIDLIKYSITGSNSNQGYQGLIYLFCKSSGVSNDIISKIISILNKPYRIKNYLSQLDQASILKASIVVQDLEIKGYHILDQKLPKEVCDELLKFATENNCNARPISGDTRQGLVSERLSYNRKNPDVVRYDFSTELLVNNGVIQSIIANPMLLLIAQGYLKTKPVIDVLSMWWHTSFLGYPDEDAAQFYHFDMDRIKWLKVFIYLTEVNENNGPHCFIEGSHKAGAIPQELLKKGYARITDQDAKKFYNIDRFVEFCAPQGTIIIEDTRGLHKGKHVKEGDRLILQIQYSNCLFGAFYTPVRISNISCNNLLNMIRIFPNSYKNYIN